MTKKTMAVNIIKAAKEQFQKNGYDKTHVDDIVRGAKITEDQFLENFKTKEQCCLKVLKSYEKLLKDNFTSYDENVNTRQRLSLYLDGFYDNADEIAAFGDPILNLYNDLRNADSELSTLSKNIIILQQRWVDDQFIIMMKSESAKDLGDRLMAALNGLLILVKLRNDPNMFKRQIIQLKSWIRSM